MLRASDVRAGAAHCGFDLMGLAPAEPLDPAPLRHWLKSGYCAGLSSMRLHLDERTNPAAMLPGAKTVVVLGIPYDKGPSGGIARYARGRDYHYTHRDRMRALRQCLCAIEPGLRTYACVDAGVAMEKAWAERAGLGFIGKNGLLVTRTHGSYLTLSLMILDAAVDAYDEPHPRLCGDCTKCLDACPTGAFPSPGVLDARRCLAYHTVENRGRVPLKLRDKFGACVFGCDVCQEACPYSQGDLPPGDIRQRARALGQLAAAEIAGLSRERFAELASATAMRRIGYDGLRRNACFSLGATRPPDAAPLLAHLAEDSCTWVREAAAWALGQLGGRT